MPNLSNSDRRQMDELIARLSDKPEDISTSQKIRRLDEAGYKTADIARYLGIRYQFAYNVLKAAQSKRAAAGAADAGAAFAAAGDGGPPGESRAAEDQWIWTTVGKSGRVDLPAIFLEAMGVREGDPIQLIVERGAVRILPRDAVIREVQAFVRRYIPDDVSLVDELLEERRAEAAREAEDAGD